MANKKTNTSRVITMAINKGGVGKTTTSITFALLLASKGFKTLLIDNDPQRNSTGFSGATIIDGETLTLEDLYIDVNDNYPEINTPVGKEYIMAAIQPTENIYDIIPCTNMLAAIENTYNGFSHLFTLKRICDALREEYDFIIIDNPPAINTLAGCGIVASDDTIIPIEPSGSVEMSVENNVSFINTLMQSTGKEINVDRIIITKMPANDTESAEQVASLSEVSESIFGCKVALPYVRLNQPFKKSFTLNFSIIEGMRIKRPQALFDYVSLVEDYLKDHKTAHNSFISCTTENGITKKLYKIPFLTKKK